MIWLYNFRINDFALGILTVFRQISAHADLQIFASHPSGMFVNATGRDIDRGLRNSAKPIIFSQRRKRDSKRNKFTLTLGKSKEAAFPPALTAGICAELDMKKALAATILALGIAVFSPACAEQLDEATNKILAEAWTAYNIGNYNKTVSLITNMAADGNPRAQVLLGRCYENGLGVEQDPAVAAQWFQLAAEQNDSEAQVLLAYCYEVGSGVPKNPQQVMNLMTRAANAGNAEAQFNLALNYSQGINGAPKNEQEAFKWAELAGQQGYAQAERFLGACYEYGFGVNANTQLAQEWYAKAAAQGLSREGSIFSKITPYTMD